jgi:DNA-directed RNA polymerase specialized sigma24 family protein
MSQPQDAMRLGRGRYTPGEVQSLIEEYAAVSASADTTRRGLRCLVQKADLDRALARIPLKLWEVVLVHGLLGVPLRETGEELRISHTAVAKRYRQGLEETIYRINGGT